MKTIIFRGKPYEVPEWVDGAAVDKDGGIYGYEYLTCPKCSHEQNTSQNNWCGKNLECRRCNQYSYYSEWTKSNSQAVE